MWSRLPARFVASMLSGHLAVGLAASALLYIVCLSGTVMVFHEEFARWEQPGVPEMESAAPAAVERAAANALVRVGESPHHFYIGLPVDGMPRMTVSTDDHSWFADGDGNLVEVVDDGWRDFIETLHYYLTLPGVLGLTLVGLLGVLMAALVMSGILALPRLFRDAFRLRLKGSSRLKEADLHNRLSVWGAPFYFAIAVSGAALGLASLVAVTMAPSLTGGDTAKFFEPVFGTEVEGSKTPAPLADISSALENFSVEYPELVPWYVSFHDPATEGQSAEILAKHPRRLIYGDNYSFDAAGELGGNTGLSDGPPGQQLVAAIYPLHFGTYGGLIVKIIYGVFGLLSCVVVASGINIWLIKRRQKGRPVPVLESAWQGIVWGTPAVLALVLLVETLPGVSMGVLIGLFWAGLAVLLATSAIRPGADRRPALCRLTAGLIAAVLVIYLVSNGGQIVSPAAIGVNGVLAGLALYLVVWSRAGRSPGLPTGNDLV